MAADIDQTPDPADVIAQLDQARKALDDWAAHLRAYQAHAEPGSLLAARRAAGIAQETITAAACDTRALTRPYLLTA
jgi:hypothetical protein